MDIGEFESTDSVALVFKYLNDKMDIEVYIGGTRRVQSLSTDLKFVLPNRVIVIAANETKATCEINTFCVE